MKNILGFLNRLSRNNIIDDSKLKAQKPDAPNVEQAALQGLVQKNQNNKVTENPAQAAFLGAAQAAQNLNKPTGVGRIFLPQDHANVNNNPQNKDLNNSYKEIFDYIFFPEGQKSQEFAAIWRDFSERRRKYFEYIQSIERERQEALRRGNSYSLPLNKARLPVQYHHDSTTTPFYGIDAFNSRNFLNILNKAFQSDEFDPDKFSSGLVDYILKNRESLAKTYGDYTGDYDVESGTWKTFYQNPPQEQAQPQAPAAQAPAPGPVGVNNNQANVALRPIKNVHLRNMLVPKLAKFDEPTTKFLNNLDINSTRINRRPPFFGSVELWSSGAFAIDDNTNPQTPGIVSFDVFRDRLRRHFASKFMNQNGTFKNDKVVSSLRDWYRMTPDWLAHRQDPDFNPNDIDWGFRKWFFNNFIPSNVDDARLQIIYKMLSQKYQQVWHELAELDNNIR
jgi:hypothetical protein